MPVMERGRGERKGGGGERRERHIRIGGRHT